MAGIKDIMKGRRDEYRVALEDLHVKDGWNSRDKDFDPEDGEDMALALSIASEGVKQPLTVFLEDGKLYLEDGHRRVAAARHAVEHLGLPSDALVPARLGDKEATQADRILSQIVRNSGKPLNPLETATVFRKLSDLGMSAAEIARRTGVTGAYVGQLASLHAAPEGVIAMVRAGTVSASLAIEALKSDGDGAEAKLTLAVETAREAGKTRATRKHLPAQRDASAGNPRRRKVALDSFVAAFIGSSTDENGYLIVTFDRDKFADFARCLGFSEQTSTRQEEDII